jgi:Protein of unknown function (DUF1501)
MAAMSKKSAGITTPFDLTTRLRREGGHKLRATDYWHFPIENKFHFHDLHATLLHLLGLDHTKLTYPFSR